MPRIGRLHSSSQGTAREYGDLEYQTPVPISQLPNYTRFVKTATKQSAAAAPVLSQLTLLQEQQRAESTDYSYKQQRRSNTPGLGALPEPPNRIVRLISY